MAASKHLLLRFVLVFICSTLFLGFQNCSNDGFSAAPSSNSALSMVPEPTPIAVLTPASTPAPTSTPATCAANMGRSCATTTGWDQLPGCGDGYICTEFWGVYYGSSNGCSYDPSSGQSAVETQFDGTQMMGRAFNNGPSSIYNAPWTAGALGASSPDRCTYIGNGTYDPFHGVADGQCHVAANYATPNTYTRVVPGTGCVHTARGTGQGTVQCDGSCQ